MRSGSGVVDRVPPAAVHGSGGGGWALLETVRGQVEAQLLRGVLENAGVAPVRLDATNLSPGAWLFMSGDPNALVRVYVPRSMLDEGRLALMEIGVQPVAPPEPPTRQRTLAGPPRWWAIITVLALAGYLIAALRNTGSL